MHKSCLMYWNIVFVMFTLGVCFGADEGRFEYPVYMVDLYNADTGCWRGMAIDGHWQPPVFVPPEKWLVGPPPSQLSGVTFPVDHYIELMFRGPIIDGPEEDIFVFEAGQCGEQALVFLTDGVSQEYLLGMAAAENTGKDEMSVIGFDISGLSLPFVPSAVKIVAMDVGGGSPGFDIAHVVARVGCGCGEKACCPYPVNGAKNVTPDVVLSWSPGAFAKGHVVFFGDTFSSVSYEAIPVIFPAQDANTFDPNILQLGKRYYWRIDEVSDSNTRNYWSGDFWTFTVADHVVLDDFESYSYSDNPIYATWDEKGWGLLSDVDSYFHSCWKAMAFDYYYNPIYYSEALRTFDPPQDWASMGIKVLELWFYGRTANAIDGQMYVLIGSGGSMVVVPYEDDPNNIAKESWQLWRIDLTSLGLDLKNIRSLGIGFRAKENSAPDLKSGTIYFDDITLRSSVCPEEQRPHADFNADCIVDFRDFNDMAFSWLRTGYRVFPVTAPREPVLWYKFDGNVNDSAGSAHGQMNGRATFSPGVYGQAINFDGKSSFVSVGSAESVFNRIDNKITITFWQYGRETSHLNSTVCCSNYEYNVSNPAIAISLGCWRPPGRYIWDFGFPWSFDNRLSGRHRNISEWSGRWNHWAFVKDAGVGSEKMEIFLNGVLYDSRAGAGWPVSEIESFEIGTGWYGGYDGLIDDFRIYNYALSLQEIAYAATNGTGIFNLQIGLPTDLNADNRVDFRDLAVFTESWLDNQLWP